MTLRLLLAMVVLSGCVGSPTPDPDAGVIGLRYVNAPCLEGELGEHTCGTFRPPPPPDAGASDGGIDGGSDGGVDAGEPPETFRLECKRDIDPVTGYRTGAPLWVAVATPCP